MIVSKKWLQDFIVEKLPDTDLLVEKLIMNVFEVESVEKVDDDEIIDIKTLPDRNHYALSHIGIAKEICAIFNLTLKNIIPDKNFKDSQKFSVKIEDEKLCRRYCGAYIENVKIADSPLWLKERLESIGQKSINNIVDATNYVMFAMGQPLHAFDADKIDGGIVVRAGKEGEVLDLLDASGLEDKKNRKIELGKGECVIADSSGPLVLAGIKGGLKTSISKDTNNIILEAGNFDPVISRKFSTIYNLRSETSKRFENEITPEYAYSGLQMCIDLILNIAGGEVEGVIDVYPRKFPTYKVGVSESEIKRLLGVSIPNKETEAILGRLNFEFEKVLPLQKIKDSINDIEGTPYKYGASVSWDAPKYFDCSSLISWIYVQAGFSLPRVAIDQYVATERIDKKDIQFGDLIFSDTGIEEGIRRVESVEFARGTKTPGVIDHVGFYLGEDKVLHSTRAFGKVVIENLSESVQFKNIVGCGRVKGVEEERFVVKAPCDRFDIRIREDLIEEIGRIYGYDHVLSKRPKIISQKNDNKKFVVECIIREYLVDQGFSEVYTYAFQSSGDIELENALASDKSFMRNNIKKQIKEALDQNTRYADLLGMEKIKIFEMGNVFTKEEERNKLSLGISFAKKIKGESAETDVKKVLDGIADILKIKTFPEYKMEEGVVELDLENIIEIADENCKLPEFKKREVNKYSPISQYPFVVRDLAVWVPEETNKDDIENIIIKHSGNLLKKISLFDVFSKDSKTSYAYRIILQSMDKTLEESEINEIMLNITNEMNEEKKVAGKIIDKISL